MARIRKSPVGRRGFLKGPRPAPRGIENPGSDHMVDVIKSLGVEYTGGMGYGAPASVGAALANRKHGRLSINIQTDGAMNYAPGVYSEGPISIPKDLGAALKRGVDRVKNGEPVMLDVITQPC